MKFPVINLAGFFYRILETLFKKRIATDISFLLVAAAVKVIGTFRKLRLDFARHK
jgi:hypothetical protein